MILSFSFRLSVIGVFDGPGTRASLDDCQSGSLGGFAQRMADAQRFARLHNESGTKKFGFPVNRNLVDQEYGIDSRDFGTKFDKFLGDERAKVFQG
jgi:hypothetical protein